MNKEQTTQLAISIDAEELQLVEESKAKQIKETFEPMVKMLEGFEGRYNELISEAKQKEIDFELTAKAKRLRLDIGKVRIETGKLKDISKERIKREDKAIMGVHNILVWAVSEKEDELKKIENHFEIIEQKRLENLQHERVKLLSPYFEEAEQMNLAVMDEDVFEAYFEKKKKDHEDRMEAARIAKEREEQRQRELELSQKRQNLLRPYFKVLEEDISNLGSMPEEEFDNLLNLLKNKLKEKEELANREEKRRILLHDKNNLLWNYETFLNRGKNRVDWVNCTDEEFKQFLVECRECKLQNEEEERARIEAEKEQKRIQEEREKQLKEEREKAAKAEAEAEKLRKAEEERKAKLEAEEQSRLNAKDSEKINQLIFEIQEIKSKYHFKSKSNKLMKQFVDQLLDKVIAYIDSKK